MKYEENSDGINSTERGICFAGSGEVESGALGRPFTLRLRIFADSYTILEDIRGVTSEKHLIDGYRYCMERGWKKPAQICISHAFPIQDIRTSIGQFDVSEEDYQFMARFIQNAVYDDYDRLVQLCDALALPSGFCLLEKRFVDVTIRYGFKPMVTIERWKKILEIRSYFEEKMRGSIYNVLPGVVGK